MIKIPIKEKKVRSIFRRPKEEQLILSGQLHWGTRMIWVLVLPNSSSHATYSERNLLKKKAVTFLRGNFFVLFSKLLTFLVAFRFIGIRNASFNLNRAKSIRRNWKRMDWRNSKSCSLFSRDTKASLPLPGAKLQSFLSN